MITKFFCFLRDYRFQLRSVAGNGIAFIAFGILVSRLQGQPVSTPDQKFWIFDGSINAILPVGNTVYVGGDFSYVGPRTGPAALFNENTGAPLGSPQQIDGVIRAILSDGSGGWFVGGAFTKIGTTAITNLAHLNSGLLLDTAWNAKVVGTAVNALALDNGRLYVGGQFTRIGGQVLSGLAGVDARTASVDWNPHFVGNAVNAMQVDGGLLYVGGNFNNVGGSARQNLAAISIATTQANSWNPGADAAVLALQVSGNTIYAGGQFLNSGSKPRNRIVALDATTGVASTTWNPNPNGIVRALAVRAGTVFVGGDFTTISVASRRGFAALDSATGSAQSLDLQLQSANTLNLVRSILLTGNSLYVGGQFTGALGEKHFMIAGVDLTTDSSLPVPLATDFNGAANASFGANALASANGRVLVGGDFLSVGGVSRNRAAALSIDSGAALPWAPEFDGSVLSLASGPKGIYVGGSFGKVNTTTPARGLALVNPLSGNAIPFSFLATNGTVAVAIRSLALNANVLYVGGAFTVVSSLPRRLVAAIDADSAEPLAAFDAKLGGGSGVASLVLGGSNLYVAGDFTTVNGVSMVRLAALSPATGKPVTWSPKPSPNTAVNVLTASSDTLYVGGQFTTISGVALRSFAAYSLTDNSLFALDASLSSGANLSSLAATSTTLYVGGSFTAIGGENKRNLAVLAPANLGAYDWNPLPDLGPKAISLTDNFAFVGGSFRFIGQNPAGFFAGFPRGAKTSISTTGSNVQIVATTGDRTDAVLQSTPSLTSPVWTDIATSAPGLPWTKLLPVVSSQQFFRVIAR